MTMLDSIKSGLSLVTYADAELFCRRKHFEGKGTFIVSEIDAQSTLRTAGIPFASWSLKSAMGQLLCLITGRACWATAEYDIKTWRSRRLDI